MISIKGVLISNTFLRNPAFLDILSRFSEAARSMDIALTQMTGAEAMSFHGEPPDFCLFWDKDIYLARTLEAHGWRLFNGADAIESCDSKALTHIRLMGSGLAVPETYILPLRFTPPSREEYAFLRPAAERLGFPLVVKEAFGSFGAQVYLARDFESLLELLDWIGPVPALLQCFVRSSQGRDLRIQMIGGECAGAVLRENDSDFRANLSRGGRAVPAVPTGAQLAAARTACETLGLDFAGVDLLFGENEEPVLCEVNSNAHFVRMERAAGVDIAGGILRHIVKSTGKS